jgi:glycosyltransferase involved in cell wall biosynthesis
MPRPLLHVVQISFFNDPAGRAPAQLLEAWPSLVDVADAALQAGVRVSVVQACLHPQQVEHHGVRYYFLPFGHTAPARGHSSPLCELLRTLAPDVLHVHGLGFPRDVLALAAMLPNVPIVLQDHANRVPRPWRRGAWRRGMAVAAGIAFCAIEQAQPFVEARLVDSKTHLYAIPESTSRFTLADQEDARRATNVSGDPAVLWVGHLDVNKDPLTVLAGISDAARLRPRLQLYCCFGVAPLLREVQDRIAADSLLRDRVHLLGRVPHERIEQLMRAADVFVLGSHREGSGFSLIEALACGLPPVVTDIPSFRALTGAGAVGMLWPCDNPHALCAALLSVTARLGPAMRAAVRAHFESELSFAALGLKLAAMYHDLVERTPSAAVSARHAQHSAPLRAS